MSDNDECLMIFFGAITSPKVSANTRLVEKSWAILGASNQKPDVKIIHNERMSGKILITG